MLLMCIAFKFYCVLLALAVSILRYLAFRGGEWSVVSVAGLSLLAGATSGLYYSLSSSEVPDQLGLVFCCKHVSFFRVDWAACTCCKKPRDLLCFCCITFLCFSHSRVLCCSTIGSRLMNNSMAANAFTVVLSSTQPCPMEVSMGGLLLSVGFMSLLFFSSDFLSKAVARALGSVLPCLLHVALLQVNTTSFSGSAALAADVSSSPTVSSPPVSAVVSSTAVSLPNGCPAISSTGRLAFNAFC